MVEAQAADFTRAVFTARVMSLLRFNCGTRSMLGFSHQSIRPESSRGLPWPDQG